MPFASSFSAMKATATVKVAPCSSCAGPKTSPLNEWAIMMWSETSTAYTENLSYLVADQLAQHAALRRENLGKAHGQVGERDRRRQQRIERRVLQEVERGRQAAPIIPARAARGRDLAHL